MDAKPTLMDLLLEYAHERQEAIIFRRQAIPCKDARPHYEDGVPPCWMGSEPEDYCERCKMRPAFKAARKRQSVALRKLHRALDRAAEGR